MDLRSLPIFAVLALAPIALVAQQAARVSSPPMTASSATPAKTTSSLPFSGLAVGVKFGVNGIGFDVATPLVKQWINLRSGASFLSYTPSTITTNGLNINGTLTLQNAATTVDFFPFHGRFRISAGMTTYNNNHLTAIMNVPAKQSFTLGSTTYYSDPTNGNPLTGNGLFTLGGKTAPRLTIGTGNMLPKKGRLTFQSELGVDFISTPTVAMNFSGVACQTLTGSVYSNCGPVATSDVQAEQVKLQNDLNDLHYYPVISFGLGYRIH
jgi:hypothetical protein